MKKLARLFVIAAVVVLAAQAIYPKHQNRRNGSFVSAVERQTLRDAPNSDLNGDVQEVLSNLKGQNSSSVPGAASAVPAAPPVPASSSISAAAQKDSVDLSAQFPPDKITNQGHIGDCHDFATVALFEAGYYRYYHVHLAFAEQDLFAQTNICSGKVCNNAQVYQAVNGTPQCSLGEGGTLGQDAAYILQHGILPDDNQSCATYAAFEAAYKQQFQSRLEKALINLSCRNKTLPKVAPGKLNSSVADRFVKPSPEADARRAAVKEALAGFQAKDKFFTWSAMGLDTETLLKLSPNTCKSMGQTQKELLLRQLEAGYPVGVGMRLLGLESWGYPKLRPTDPPDATGSHGFVVVGYKNKGGKLTFQTRNSWVKNGQHLDPELTEGDLCRIITLAVLLTPQEAAAQADTLERPVSAAAASSQVPIPAKLVEQMLKQLQELTDYLDAVIMSADETKKFDQIAQYVRAHKSSDYADAITSKDPATKSKHAFTVTSYDKGRDAAETISLSRRTLSGFYVMTFLLSEGRLSDFTPGAVPAEMQRRIAREEINYWLNYKPSLVPVSPP